MAVTVLLTIWAPWACAAAFAPPAADVAQTTETVKVRLRPEVFGIIASRPAPPYRSMRIFSPGRNGLPVPDSR